MPQDSVTTQQFGFLLMPNFALMSYASAVEPLRTTNVLAGGKFYEVVHLSADGSPVSSSGGLTFECRPIATHGAACHSLLVCAGGGPQDWVLTDTLLDSLRRFSRRGVRIGAISSGSYVLAAAGLLDNRDFTIHWEHAPLLRETFPHLNPRQARYVLDGNRLTCAGGIAPLDMMHALIAQRMGAHFARRVSDRNLHVSVAESTAPQRASTAERFGTYHPVLVNVLEKMEATVEQPLSRSALAGLVGVSERHLNRLFVTELGTGFHRSYVAIRLRHAQGLLKESPLSVAEIAYATGFSSAAHFSRSYFEAFGQRPREARRKAEGRS